MLLLGEFNGKLFLLMAAKETASQLNEVKVPVLDVLLLFSEQDGGTLSLLRVR